MSARMTAEREKEIRRMVADHVMGFDAELLRELDAVRAERAAMERNYDKLVRDYERLGVELGQAVHTCNWMAEQRAKATDADVEWLAQLERYQRSMADKFQTATNFNLAAEHSLFADRYARILAALGRPSVERATTTGGGEGKG